MNTKVALLLLVLFIMVAERVAAGDPDVPSTKEFNIGRAFAHCAKLRKVNYDIWFTGIISSNIISSPQPDKSSKMIEFQF